MVSNHQYHSLCTEKRPLLTDNECIPLLQIGSSHQLGQRNQLCTLTIIRCIATRFLCSTLEIIYANYLHLHSAWGATERKTVRQQIRTRSGSSYYTFYFLYQLPVFKQPTDKRKLELDMLRSSFVLAVK